MICHKDMATSPVCQGVVKGLARHDAVAHARVHVVADAVPVNVTFAPPAADAQNVDVGARLCGARRIVARARVHAFVHTVPNAVLVRIHIAKQPKQID